MIREMTASEKVFCNKLRARGLKVDIYTRTDQAEMLVDIIVTEVRRRTTMDEKRAKALIEEMWSEGYTLAAAGSQKMWHWFCYETERSPSSDWWYKRIDNAVLRRTGWAS